MKHCDDYINDFRAPMCLRAFLLRHRLPASDGMVLDAAGFNPSLYADYKGERVRVVMASRLGDVGITSNLSAERGYDHRVHVEELANFSGSGEPQEGQG